MKELYAKLFIIQQTLQAGKNRTAKNYSYRNLSDILKAVKPILSSLNLIMYINDKPIEIGGRFYIESTVTLLDIETSQAIENRAVCREAESQAGIGVGQLTGATSSYSRKYCLAGLFLLEDDEENDLDKLQEKTEKVEKDEAKLKKDDEAKRSILGKNIFNLAGNNKKVAIDILENITKFEKDGKKVEGIRELIKLEGKRLNIACARISKIIELSKEKQIKVINEICEIENVKGIET